MGDIIAYKITKKKSDLPSKSGKYFVKTEQSFFDTSNFLLALENKETD